MQNSPIGWVGGKKRLREAIIQRFPAHSIYVEVFAGAAWVLFGKAQDASEVEVVNDLNGELTNFYRCVREKPLELIEKLQFRLISQEEFKNYTRCGVKTGSEVERAAVFFWALKLAFASRASNKATFGYRLDQPQTFRSDLIEPIIKGAHERLQRVLVFSEDFQTLINRLDRDEAFFYCDPPYYGTKGCYAHEFTVADHERLATALRRIKGKFLLSYGDCQEIRDLYSWATVEELTTRYSIMRKESSRKQIFTELLIRKH